MTMDNVKIRETHYFSSFLLSTIFITVVWRHVFLRSVVLRFEKILLNLDKQSRVSRCAVFLLRKPGGTSQVRCLSTRPLPFEPP